MTRRPVLLRANSRCPRAWLGATALAGLLLAGTTPLPAQPLTDAAATHPTLVLQLGHTQEVTTAALSPDGGLLATGSDDRTIKLWDLPSGVVRATLDAPSQPVGSVVFSPDGRMLASGSQDGFIQLWNPHTGSLIREFAAETGSMLHVAFSPDGRLLVSGSVEGTIKCWDVRSGKLLRTITPGNTPDSSRVLAIDISPDGRTIASGTAGPDAQNPAPAKIQLWDLATGRLKRSLPPQRKSIEAVVYSPDGKSLATGGGDGTLRLWNSQTGALKWSALARQEWVTSIAFSPDGRQLATAGISGSVKLWEARTGRLQRSVPDDQASVVTFSRDGRLLVIGHRDGSVLLSDARTAVRRQVLPGWSRPRISALAYSPADGSLALGVTGRAPQGWGGFIELWNPRAADLRGTLSSGRSAPDSLAFSPDGKRLAGLDLEELRVWDLTQQRLSRTLKEPQAGDVFLSFNLAMTPDSRSVAAADTVALRFWDLQSGRVQRVLNPGGAAPMVLSAFSLSPDGQSAAIGRGGFDPQSLRVFREVKLWSLRTGKPEQTVSSVVKAARGPGGEPVKGVSLLDAMVMPVLYSPDGRRLAVGSAAGLELWDLRTGRLEHTLNDNCGALAFSPDGRSLVTASGTLWDSRAGAMVRRLEGARFVQDVERIAFAPDGRQVAGCNEEGTVRFWNPNSGRLVATLMLLSVRQNAQGHIASDWLLRTPGGYYAGSPGVERLFRWRVGAHLYPAQQYAPQFHRPDQVRQVIGGAR